MVQGRKMGPLGLAEHIAVEVRAVEHEIRRHDEQEAKDLDLLQRTLLSLGASAAPHCTPAQAKLWAWVHRAMERRVVENRDFEDPRHEALFEFAEAVA